MSETATDNLAAVLGDSGRVVKVGDTEITIRPLVVAQITHMLRALNPLLQRLRQGVQGDASSLAWMLADEPDELASHATASAQPEIFGSCPAGGDADSLRASPVDHWRDC